MNRHFTASCVVVTALFLSCGGSGGETDSGPGDVTQDPGAGDVIDTGPADGTPCDDGDQCTKDDVWKGGVCAGVEYDCSKGAPFCITRGCDGDGGCTVVDVHDGFCFVEGACFSDGAQNPKDACSKCDPALDQEAWSAASGVSNCSDGNACTLDDHCEAGVCTGGGLKDCNDDNPCTNDHCDESLGCVHDNIEGPCEDDDLCTLQDTCVDGVCTGGQEVPDCDDSNPCTVDACDPSVGCVNDNDPAVACDDDNECTLDNCNEETGCGHEAVEGPCEDGDMCTLGDSCVDGECQSGTDTPDCDDDNECTADTCNPIAGCIHAGVPGDCDDDNDCTVDDTCLGGICSGVKTGLCPDCEVTPNPHANKVTVLQMGTSGHPGQGLDLDGDPTTCAPASDCSGGIDNELGLLAIFVNPAVTEAVENGYLMYVLEFVDFEADDDHFTVHFHGADLAESNLLCDFQNDECEYHPLWVSFDAECNPLVSFDNAVLQGNTLTAGGPGYTFPLQFSLINGGQLELAIKNAQIEADVQLTQAGTQVFSMVGFIGGAVDKNELIDGVEKLPGDAFPIDKETVKELLETFITNDLDTDMDGTPDSASVAVRFDTIPADIVPKE